ncbi:MAG: carbohydrate-binding family 9-like protein [Balneolaceae bacterium]|nr:carbohydrate-binding family 9-like protein [Balneolaceae bacterium]
MKKLLPGLGAFFVIIGMGCTPPAPTPIEVDIPEHYVVHKTAAALTIDGKPDEPQWDDASWTHSFIDIEGESKPAPYFDTRVKMLWDEEYLYFYSEMEEEHIWGDITERDAVIFYNNDLEIFLKPNPNQPHYVEFEVNALGTLWELILMHPYRLGGPVSNYWDVNGTQVGLAFNGTLNDPTDIDSLWSIEMAIPLDALADLSPGKTVEEGTTWRLNFSRVQWKHQLNEGTYQRKTDRTSGEYLPALNWVWTSQHAVNMHQPEYWGYLQFTEQPPSIPQAFENDPWEVEYQLLFYVYRKQLAWKKNHGTFSDQLAPFGGPLFSVNGNKYEITLNSGISTFELSIHDPSKGTITLNNHGYLSIK